MSASPECPGCLGVHFHPLENRSFLSICKTCGLVFDNPRPTPEMIASFYNQEHQYDGWIRDLKVRDSLWERRLRKMRPYARRGGLLDVGSGIGQFLHHAKKEYSPVAGVEISLVAIGISKQLYNLEILSGDVDCLEDIERFENVTAFHVLEHVHHPLTFLNSCWRLLKPGGRLFIAVPNELEALAYRIGTHTLHEISMREPEIHLSHFTTGSLCEILRRSGFEIINLSLDPFWVGRRGIFQTSRYYVMGALQRLVGINLYPTIWAVASKPSTRQ